MVTLIAAGSSAPLGHHFIAFAVVLIAVVAGCLVWALRDGAQRGARDADVAEVLTGRHASPEVAADTGYVGRRHYDDSPTVSLLRDNGSWIA